MARTVHQHYPRNLGWKKSQQEPWVFFQRPQSLPHWVCTCSIKGTSALYLFKSSPPILDVHRGRLYEAGDMLASLNPSCKWKLLPTFIEPENLSSVHHYFVESVLKKLIAKCNEKE